MDYPTDWAAIRTKYFIAALVPQKQAPGSQVLATNENGDLKYDVGLIFDAGRPFLSTLYLGPLEYNRIKGLGDDEIAFTGEEFHVCFGEFHERVSIDERLMA